MRFIDVLNTDFFILGKESNDMVTRIKRLARQGIEHSKRLAGLLETDKELNEQHNRKLKQRKRDIYLHGLRNGELNTIKADIEKAKATLLVLNRLRMGIQFDVEDTLYQMELAQTTISALRAKQSALLNAGNKNGLTNVELARLIAAENIVKSHSAAIQSYKKAETMATTLTLEEGETLTYRIEMAEKHIRHLMVRRDDVALECRAIKARLQEPLPPKHGRSTFMQNIISAGHTDVNMTAHQLDAELAMYKEWLAGNMDILKKLANDDKSNAGRIKKARHTAQQKKEAKARREATPTGMANRLVNRVEIMRSSGNQNVVTERPRTPAKKRYSAH